MWDSLRTDAKGRIAFKVTRQRIRQLRRYTQKDNRSTYEEL